ncbi:P12 family lipoprotein [Borreliella bavariensis]|uniref:P12 family lipoprotein n=1 Tax=Borreliella bavariensis TaxID=664662 RepID=UPI001F1FECAC|nr:P12 family lipoprotein [Borreliella bavariensis]
MSYIDIAKQNIRSEALFLCKVKESLKEVIIKRLESENRSVSQLSKQALNKIENTLKSSESSYFKKV